MNFSEILNILFGTGLVGLVVTVVTMKATVRKANADAEKAKADAETVRITNTENATRILVENIVKPLKEELHATREKLSATEGLMAGIQKELASTKRALSRLSRAVESANNCPHADDCVVLRKLRNNKKTQTEQTQTSSTSEKSDTTAAVTRVITTQTVPESKVDMVISVDSLLKLPEGAVYRESKDRAHVEATHRGGVIYITGTCDSLQRQVEYYESLYHTARDALEQTEQSLRQEKEKKRNRHGLSCCLNVRPAL